MKVNVVNKLRYSREWNQLQDVCGQIDDVAGSFKEMLLPVTYNGTA